MPKKILVADDNPAIAEGVASLLAEYGYETASETDGQKIYQMKDVPDLLLLDVWMSGEDGREICKFLKGKKGTKGVPIILFSASREIRKSAADAGANDFMEKPFDIDELVEKIEQNIN